MRKVLPLQVGCFRLSFMAALRVRMEVLAMGPDDFRRVALTMPDAIESTHMKHPDFRVGKKVFATLGFPDNRSVMVKLRPDQQKEIIAKNPDAFRPANGTWGKRGSTLVDLDKVNEKMAARIIRMAWENAVA